MSSKAHYGWAVAGLFAIMVLAYGSRSPVFLIAPVLFVIYHGVMAIKKGE